MDTDRGGKGWEFNNKVVKSESLGGRGVFSFFSDSGGIDKCLRDRWCFFVESAQAQQWTCSTGG